MDESQGQVVESICVPVLGALRSEGTHTNKLAKGGLIFAYGVTSSGKTHTVLGNEKEPGILEFFFRELPKPFQLTAVQVYNDQFFPLIGTRNKIQLIQSSGRLEFKNHEPMEVSDDNIKEVLLQIKENRAQKTTSHNSKSSRSHAIFRIVSEGRIIGVVDLAGSQRTSEGCEIGETSNINMSLLTLGRCIKCLRDRNVQIPFRDSKLTMALAEYFTVDNKLVMLININTSRKMYGETLNVLEYAAIAKDIKPTTPLPKSKLRQIITATDGIEESKVVQPERVASPLFPVPASASKAGSANKGDLNFQEDGIDEKTAAAVREYIVRNDMEVRKQHYMEKHQCHNEDFNLFFDKQIQEQKDMEDQFFRSLKEPIQNMGEQKREGAELTSTSMNTMPLSDAKLQSSFKKKTLAELRLQYQNELQTMREMYEEQLEEQITKRDILERMFQDEVEQLRKVQLASAELQKKLEEEVQRRGKMEEEGEGQAATLSKYQQQKMQLKVELERSQEQLLRAQKLKEEISLMKEEEKKFQLRLKSILKEKNEYCQTITGEKAKLLQQVNELLKAQKEATAKQEKQEKQRKHQEAQYKARLKNANEELERKEKEMEKLRVENARLVRQQEERKKLEAAGEAQAEALIKEIKREPEERKQPEGAQQQQLQSRHNRRQQKKKKQHTDASGSKEGHEASKKPQKRNGRNASRKTSKRQTSEEEESKQQTDPTPLKERLRTRSKDPK